MAKTYKEPRKLYKFRGLKKLRPRACARGHGCARPSSGTPRGSCLHEITEDNWSGNAEVKEQGAWHVGCKRRSEDLSYV